MFYVSIDWRAIPLLCIELFAQITDLEEYYPTRAETEVFETYAGDMVNFFASGAQDEPINIIELGAGDGRKTKILLRELLDQDVNFEYVPIDISRQAMGNLFEAMGTHFKEDDLAVHGIVGDFFQSIQHVVSLHPSRRSAVLFIGSSIGNFSMAEGERFLTSLKNCMNPKDILLLGVDLRKDIETMRRAYSDSKGVTREFNLNLLARMNREIGTDFDEGAFQHLAAYNPVIGAMQSFLLATEPLVVSMNANKTQTEFGTKASQETKANILEFSFNSFEPIYVECSYKYTPDSAQDMLMESGFHVRKKFFDRKLGYLDLVAEV